MPKQQDGARNALSGFLFQMIVDVGLMARAIDLAGASDADGEMEAILAIIRDGQINEEMFGQDAVIRSVMGNANQSCVLTQYKYSRQTPPPSIGREELLKIVDRLSNSCVEATKTGNMPTGFVLLTNRPIGSTGDKLIEDAKRNLPNNDLEPADRRDILRQLIIPLSDTVNPNKWFAEIEHLGMRYGALPHEINEWLTYLFGQFATGIAVGAGSAITKKILLQSLLDHGEAKTLHPTDVADTSGSAILEKYNETEIHQPLRREVINEIVKSTSEHALVILCGDGGGGKTVNLFEWARECVSGMPPDERVFTGIAHATEVNNQWVSRLVANWMNLPTHNARCKEDLDITLDRMLIANTGVRYPVLRLAIDGLDECSVSELRDRANDIIKWFLQENKRIHREVGSLPRATLVVTCRTLDSLDQTYFTDWTGFHDVSAQVHKITISDFSDNELLALIQERCSETVRSLIRTTLLMSFTNKTDELQEIYPITMEKSFHVGASGDSRVVSTLKHPGMWGAFDKLPDEVQIAALSGDEIAIAEMARLFRKRFYRKLVRRDKNQNLTEEELHLILTQVITQHNHASEWDLANKKDWILAACAAVPISPIQATILYREALSGGLIAESNPGVWYWKHPIAVMDLLPEPKLQLQGNPK